jgi:dTDP-4-dehydrorhamnose reductase
MRYLITGSNGLLGQHLVKLLRAAGHEVVATARGSNRLKDQQGYVFASLDITDAIQVHQVIAEYAPDVILHGAAMTQVDDCEREPAACWTSNVKATEHLVRAAQNVGAAFLLLSTDFIFDGADGPYDEQALPNPISYYGLSKVAAEMLLPTSGLRWGIARTVLVYGLAEDMSRSNIVLWVKKSLEEGKRIKVVNDQWRTPTLVQDLAEGCRLIAGKLLEDSQAVPGVFNISGKDLLTPYDMALQVADYFGLDRSLIAQADASTFTQTARRPAKTGFIIERARKELGYEPHTFSEGLKIMAEALRNGLA